MRHTFFSPNFIARNVKLLQRIDGHRYSFSNIFEVNATEHLRFLKKNMFLLQKQRIKLVGLLKYVNHFLTRVKEPSSKLFLLPMNICFTFQVLL